MTMQKLIAICTLLASGAFSTAGATEIWEACNSCSDRQRLRAAIRAVPADPPSHVDVYIMDFTREALRKYRVSTIYEPFDSGYFPSAQIVPVEAHIEYEFAEGVRAIKRDIVTAMAGTLIPADVAESAFDIVHNSLLQKLVSDYVNDNLSIWQTIGAPVSVPLQAFGKIVDLNFVVTVTFSDGSKAKFALTGLEGSLTEIHYTFEFVKGSARDADDNLIPSSAEQAAPYVGVSSTQAFADNMVEFILRWYSDGHVSVQCRSEVTADGVTVTCLRR
jgi:hypothetical protein